jgi:DMSO/TMAO reductase YedYZ molybdopterin-dependent catalytic subunit
MADLEKLAQITVKARDHGGEEANYEGASLADVMKRAGMDLAADQHGRGLTRYLLAEAADHYHILFALPEFDPEFTDRHILVAYRKDGKPLSPTEGPLRLIVPDDKRQARWLRSLTTLTIADSVPPYERNKKP